MPGCACRPALTSRGRSPTLYFISPAAVSARVMTAPTSIARRRDCRRAGRRWSAASGQSTSADPAPQQPGAEAGATGVRIVWRGVRWLKPSWLERWSPASASVAAAWGWLNPFGQAEEIRDVIGRRNSRLDQERALRAVSLVIVGDTERRAVGHIGDGVGFDDGLAIRVPPDLTRIAVDLALRHRRRRQMMHVEPLLDDLVGVGRD